MRGVNKVMLIGNLGKDPDMQYAEGTIPVVKFPLATTETYKDKNGRLMSQTEWHTVVLWRGLAELAQKYLHKGSLIYLEGRLRTRNWEDREGTKKFATEVVGDNLIMLDKRSDGQHGGGFSIPPRHAHRQLVPRFFCSERSRHESAVRRAAPTHLIQRTQVLCHFRTSHLQVHAPARHTAHDFSTHRLTLLRR